MNESQKGQGKNIQWHPAFCSAMQLELLENKDDLEYRDEFILNTKPLQIDLVVIKKPRMCEVKNAIGKIFRGHNIIEFKSPRDSLNVDDYFKVIAYACLYKVKDGRVDKIKSSDITLSFIRDYRPEKLFREFEEDNMTVCSFKDGIYYVGGSLFPMQVIVTSELDREEHAWLPVLSEKLSMCEAERVLHKVMNLSGQTEKNLADSVMAVSMAANKSLFEEMKEEPDMYKFMEMWMGDEIKRREEAAEEAAKIKTAKRMLKRGRLTYEEIAEDIDLSLEEVEFLAKEVESEFQTV